MTEYASKDELFDATDVAEAEDLTLPSGKVVQVRGLTGFEVRVMHKKRRGGVDPDSVLLAMGLVQPKLTEAEAERWLRAKPAGETNAVMEKIRDLSGLNDKSPEAAYKSIRRGPGE